MQVKVTCPCCNAQRESKIDESKRRLWIYDCPKCQQISVLTFEDN